jgi:hypothetical protein
MTYERRIKQRTKGWTTGRKSGGPFEVGWQENVNDLKE